MTGYSIARQTIRQPAKEGSEIDKERDRRRERHRDRHKGRQRAVDERGLTPCAENLLHAVMNSLMGCTDCFLRQRRIYHIIP